LFHLFQEKNQTSTKKKNKLEEKAVDSVSFLDDNKDFLQLLATPQSQETQVDVPNSLPNLQMKRKSQDNQNRGILKIDIIQSDFQFSKSDLPSTSEKLSPIVKLENIPQKLKIPKSLTVLVYVVLDTNVFIHHLTEAIRIIHDASIRLVVPIVVTRELDGLKKHCNDVIARNAKLANQFLLKNKDKAIGQLSHESLLDSSSVTSLTNDELIIACASYFQKKVFDNTVLVSNDTNLQVKAIFHFGLKSMSTELFMAEFLNKDKNRV